MSLDIEAIEDLIYTSLNQYITDTVGTIQIVYAEQTIPLQLLQMPRITLKLSDPYNTDIINSQEIRETVTSTNPSFDDDVMHNYKFTPQLTLSVTGYGNKDKPVRTYLDKAREFFLVPKLAGYIFEEYSDGVIKSVGDTEDRTTFLETEYQTRYGFDVLLEFEDVVQVRENTIENIELSLNNEEINTEV